MAKLVKTKHSNIGESLRISCYPQMLDLAIRVNHIELKAALISHYISMLSTNPCSEIMVLIDLFERVRVPELYGVTHFTMLGLIWDEYDFEIAQKTRSSLYKGHFELTRMWKRLDKPHLEILHCRPCSVDNDSTETAETISACEASWRKLWSYLTRDPSVLAMPPFDVIQRLKHIVALMDSTQHDLDGRNTSSSKYFSKLRAVCVISLLEFCIGKVLTRGAVSKPGMLV
jgi:hypothetical protein